MSNTDPPPQKNPPGMNPGAREGQAVLISYMTPSMLLIVKFGRSLVWDRGEKKST